MDNARIIGSHRNMLKIPKWAHDEMRPTGMDYLDVGHVQRYDDLHQKFRDYERDSDTIIKRIKLDSNSTVIDMGAGTGAFGLPLVECDVDVEDGDVLAVDFEDGKIVNADTGDVYTFPPLPDFLVKLLEVGLIENTKRKLGRG